MGLVCEVVSCEVEEGESRVCFCVCVFCVLVFYKNQFFSYTMQPHRAFSYGRIKLMVRANLGPEP